MSFSGDFGRSVAQNGRKVTSSARFYPLRDEEEMGRVYKAMDDIFLGALKLGGTLSGEHGIGLGKLRYMEDQHGPAAMNAMRSIKRALDPNLILNPGKLVGEC